MALYKLELVGTGTGTTNGQVYKTIYSTSNTLGYTGNASAWLKYGSQGNSGPEYFYARYRNNLADLAYPPTTLYWGAKRGADPTAGALANGNFAWSTVQGAAIGANAAAFPSGTSEGAKYKLVVTQVTSMSFPVQPLGGAISAPSNVADGVIANATVTIGANVTLTAGNPTNNIDTITRKASVFSQWVLSLVGAISGIDRNTVYTSASGSRTVYASTSLTRAFSETDFINYTLYLYCLFKDGTNVAPDFSFNKAVTSTSGCVTVSVLTNGTYVPFTRLSAGASELARFCSAFTAGGFDIRANQTTSFYPKNLGNGNVAVVFTAASPYVVTGWSFNAARPSTPNIQTSAASQTLSGNSINGIHVFIADMSAAYGLIIREGTGTPPSGFAFMATTKCVCDGVTYPSPYTVTKTGAAAFSVSAVFTPSSDAPGRTATLLCLNTSTQAYSEYAKERPDSSATAFGLVPVYIPAYKISASNFSLNVSYTGQSVTGMHVLSVAQGPTGLNGVGSLLPLSGIACWAGPLARNFPVVIELDVSRAGGVDEDDLFFSAEGLVNLQATWAVSATYGRRIVTLTANLSDVTAASAAILIRVTRRINVASITPQVCLESFMQPGVMTQTVQGVFPTARSDVFGRIDVTSPFSPGDEIGEVSVELTREQGYAPHRMEILVGEAVRAVKYAVDEEDGYTFSMGLLDEDDGGDVTVRLVVRASECPAPTVTGKLSVDNGMFVAVVENLTDTVSGRWHTGDLARLTVTPPVMSGTQMPGLAVFGIEYNGTVMSIGGSPVQVTVPLDVSGAHRFTVAMAGTATLATKMDGGADFTPTEAPPSLVIGGEMVVRAGLTFYRLGAPLSLTVPPMSDGNTAIYIRHATKLVASGFPDTVLNDYVVSGALALALRGNDTVTVFYSLGVQNPWVCLALFDYDTDAYVTTNRPAYDVVPTGDAVLGENTAFTPEKPSTLSPPGNGYWDAVFFAARIVSDGLLPRVRMSVSASGVPYTLERWGGGSWNPVSMGSGGVVLQSTSFFRWARGYRADQKVEVTVLRAIDAAGGTELSVQPNVSALASNVWDYTGKPPFTVTALKGSDVSVFAFAVPGYAFVEWRLADGSVAGRSQALTLNVGIAGVSLRPVYVLASGGSWDMVMVLNGSARETEEGLWVSKEFRAQWPWSPLTAVVVRSDHSGSCRLTVRNGRAERTVRSDVVSNAPENVSINIADNGMRRVPLPKDGMSRFHRVALAVTGGEVSSVSVATGAGTLKGGH